LIGGTSVTGGLGIKPVEIQAKLFGWDPVASKKVFEIDPVAGTSAITCLIVGPDKNVWGVADGTLFIFNPSERRVVSTHPLFKVDYAAKNYNIWRDAFLVVHPSGVVYGTLDGKLFQIDPKTMGVTTLREKDVQLLTMDGQGRLYFRDTINLWQFAP